MSKEEMNIMHNVLLEMMNSRRLQKHVRHTLFIWKILESTEIVPGIIS